MPCYVCKHNQVKDLDRSLLIGASLSHLSQTYGFSLADLKRHQEHLEHKIRLAQTQVRSSLLQTCLFNLSRVLELVLHTARLAKGDGNFPIALQASREVTRIIALMAKLDFRLDPTLVHCLLDNHDWVGNGALLPYASEVIPQTRHYMAVNLFSHCPEAEAEPDLDRTQVSPLQTPNPEADTRGPSVVNPKTLCRKHQPPSGKSQNKPKKKREISAKLARKISSSIDFSEEYHKDKRCEKITAKTAVSPEPGPRSDASANPPLVPPGNLRLSKFRLFFQKLQG